MKKLVVIIGIFFPFQLAFNTAPFSAPQCDFDYQNSICTSDLDLDCDSDADDVTIFINGFGRSRFNIPCPPNGPTPVEKTGQTTSYATGDDGDLEKGVPWPYPPRFNDRGTGTVVDNLTGLTWLENANCFGQRTWADAIADCNGLANGSCGLMDGSSAGDWRLPNAKELLSLIDYSQNAPALPLGHPFNSVGNGYYWTSTTEAASGEYAWVVFMFTGYMIDQTKTLGYSVWPVRGGH